VPQKVFRAFNPIPNIFEKMLSFTLPETSEESLGMGFDGGPSNLLVRATFNIEHRCFLHVSESVTGKSGHWPLYSLCFA
jgi:hypothetical protein